MNKIRTKIFLNQRSSSSNNILENKNKYLTNYFNKINKNNNEEIKLFINSKFSFSKYKRSISPNCFINHKKEKIFKNKKILNKYIRKNDRKKNERKNC